MIKIIRSPAPWSSEKDTEANTLRLNFYPRTKNGMSKNLTHLLAKKGLSENLFEKIQKFSRDEGQREAVRLHKEFLVGSANITGSSSFYDFLKKENLNKKAFVCNGSACMTAGTQEQVIDGLSKHFDQEEIGDVCCIGRCYENAAFQINNHNYSGTAISQLEEIIDADHSFTPSKQIQFTSFSPTCVFVREPGSQWSYSALFKKLQQTGPQHTLQQVIQSKLRGRGGAGFPMGLKMETCKDANGTQKYIICNADEGDPGSYSDRFLLERLPHSVLHGMLICGFTVGADRGILYIRGEYPEAIQIIEEGIRAYEEQRGAWPFEFKIIKGAGSYICGEETALLNSIEGQRPEVRIRPPFPTEYGLYGCPTLVNNVETLACLPFIIQEGGDQFRNIGTNGSTGTKLVCLDGYFKNPGVFEIEMGTPLNTLIDTIGQGFREPVKALHIGGPLGGVIPRGKWSDLTLDFESFEKEGFILGHASVVCIPESFPMIRYLEHLFQFTAHESCGKCFPCRLGSQRGRELLTSAIEEHQGIDLELFEDLLGTMQLGSLCGLGSGLPPAVKNILKYFQDELKPYFLQN